MMLVNTERAGGGGGGGGDGAMPLLRYHLIGIVQRIRDYISGIG